MAEEIRIFDNAFCDANSASASGDNLGVGPANFRWVRVGPLTDPVFFTDGSLKACLEFQGRRKYIGWLLEPSELRPENYVIAHNLLKKHQLHYILTYDRLLLNECDRALFYPYGGSWISLDKWGVHEKTEGVSIIASHKKQTLGHKMRHDTIEYYSDYFGGIYGTAYQRVKSKFEALASYRYSVVIESSKQNYYFTEKLIDCLSVGTVPIYWGCPAIGDFFNKHGIITFDKVKDLHQILRHIDRKDYESRLGAIAENLELAKQYRVCEDWIWDNHREIFE